MALKLEKKDWLEVIELAVTWIAAMGMFIYGVAKVAQFNGAADIDTPVSELSGQSLMWAFYGYSLSFALIIGAIEITGGALLLFKKTRVLGGLLLTTVLTNIILQDIFYQVNAGALRAAVIYQLCVCIILFLNRDRLFNALKQVLAIGPSSSFNKKRIFILAVAFFLFVLLRVGEFYISTGGF